MLDPLMRCDAYFIAYDAVEYGIVIAMKPTGSSEWVPIQLLSKRTPISGNDGRKITDARTPVSRNLTESDFRNIIHARPYPSADELQAAYSSQVKQSVLDDLINRMGLNNAIVKFFAGAVKAALSFGFNSPIES